MWQPRLCKTKDWLELTLRLRCKLLQLLLDVANHLRFLALKHTHRYRPIDRHNYRQTDRQTDRQTYDMNCTNFPTDTRTNNAGYRRSPTALHCVSKNDTDLAHYNFDADQSILIIFGRDVAERVCYQRWLAITPLLTNVSALPWETRTPEIVSFQSCCIPCVENEMTRREILLAYCT